MGANRCLTGWACLLGSDVAVRSPGAGPLSEWEKLMRKRSSRARIRCWLGIWLRGGVYSDKGGAKKVCNCIMCKLKMM